MTDQELHETTDALFAGLKKIAPDMCCPDHYAAHHLAHQYVEANQMVLYELRKQLTNQSKLIADTQREIAYHQVQYDNAVAVQKSVWAQHEQQFAELQKERDEARQEVQIITKRMEMLENFITRVDGLPKLQLTPEMHRELSDIVNGRV